MQQRVKSLPDLSFYPESYLAEHAFKNPTQFGRDKQTDIQRLIDIADLCLLPYAHAKEKIATALNSTDEHDRYWGCIVCSCFGKQALGYAKELIRLAATDPNLLVRVRAAEYLGLVGAEDPRPTIMDCLQKSSSGIECNLILNSAVLLHSGSPKYSFSIRASNLHSNAIKSEEVQRRLTYFN
jgi:HEAT repeat protein